MNFRHAELSNGLSVVLEPDDRVYSTAVGFFVKTGSRDEAAEEAGLSHFLEHMVFKGTARRDALAVNRDFDRVGAKHNAQTSEEDTIYHATCLPEHLGATLDVLADILRPKLDGEDFATEKQVILEEIAMYEDNPAMVAYEAAKAAHFGEHPLGRSVLGTSATVGALEVERMREYFARRYSPRNVVMAVAGRADWSQVLELAERHCGGWSGEAAGREAAPARGLQGFKAIHRKDDQQMTVVGVADAPPFESKARYAAGLLATVLGDYTGSRLYWELIDPGYADGVDLSYQEFNGAGTFLTFLSCDPDEAQANLDRIADVYRAIAAEGPTEEELERARNKVLSRLVIRSERPMGRLMTVGYHWAYDREHMTIEREVREFSAVTVEDVRGVLREFPLVPMTVVAAGPEPDLTPPV